MSDGFQARPYGAQPSVPAPTADPYAQSRQDRYGAQVAQSGGVRPPHGATNGQGEAYELDPLANSRGPGTMAEFFQEIEDNINRIDQLHSKSLQAISGESTEASSQQLDALTAETRSMQNHVRTAIRVLEQQYASMDPANKDRHVRRTQTDNLKRRFMEQTKRFMQMEEQYRERSKARARRQMEIANPQATEDEINEAIESDQGTQVFANALLRSNRSGEARSALREVQARHADIKKIERTITELAQLMQDMAMMVEQQDMTQVERAAENVNQDVEQGNVHMDKAIKSAISARKKKWWCLFVIVLIIVAVVLIAVLVKTVGQ